MQPHRRIDVRRVLYRGKDAIYGRYCPRIGEGPVFQFQRERPRRRFIGRVIKLSNKGGSMAHRNRDTRGRVYAPGIRVSVNISQKRRGRKL